MDEAFDAIAEQRHVKIDEQTEMHPGKSEVGKNLRIVDWKKLGYGFQFHDDAFLHQEIDSISFVFELFAIINHRLR